MGGYLLELGFVHGRQLIKNVVDLDTHARIFSMASNASLLSALTFWDYAAVFPSVIHDWIFLVVAANGFPEGFCNLIDGIYYINMAYIDISGQIIFLLTYLSGVLQGCPLSGA